MLADKALPDFLMIFLLKVYKNYSLTLYANFNLQPLISVQFIFFVLEHLFIFKKIKDICTIFFLYIT